MIFDLCQKYAVNMVDFCQYFCFELLSLIGIVFYPWIMLYVLVRSYRINRSYILLKLSESKSLRIDSKFSNRPRSMSSFLLTKHQTYVQEKSEKYQVQMLLLRFCQFFLIAAPQTSMHIFVYMTEYDKIYRNNEEHLALFYVSISTSLLIFFQFLWDCMCAIK